jgi:hypothetical protein
MNFSSKKEFLRKKKKPLLHYTTGIGGSIGKSGS